MKKRIEAAVFGIAISLVGLGLLWHYGNWMLALGAFMLVWGNNIGQDARP